MEEMAQKLADEARRAQPNSALGDLDLLRPLGAGERALLEALLGQEGVGIIVLDAHRRVLLHNTAAERMLRPEAASGWLAEACSVKASRPDGQTFEASGWPSDGPQPASQAYGAPLRELQVEGLQGERRQLLGSYSPILGRDGSPIGFVVSFVDVTAQQEREAAALALEQRAARRAARLLEVTAAAARARSAEEAAVTVIDEGCAAMGAIDGSIWLLDEVAREVRLAHAAPYTARVRSRFARIPLDADKAYPVLDVLRTGEPLWLGSRAEFHAAYPGFEETDDYRSLTEYAIACLPLTVGDRCLGVLSFSFGEARSLEEADRGFLLVLARHSAQALERARVLAAEQRARAAAEAAEARSAFLSEAAGVLASSLDYEATLTSVARLAVPGIADWCFVDLVEDFRKGLPAKVVEHVDPAAVKAAREQRRSPPNQVARGGVREVLRTGWPEVHPDITDEVLAASARSEEELDAIRALGLRSSMTVPMTARGRVLGAISLFSSKPGRRYGAADLEMAQHLARRAGLAVENARLYREAQDAVLAREEVLAFVSHDLKNPLSAVVMSTTMLERVPSDAQAVARHAATIRRSAERMDRLIRDLLDLSSLDAGRLDLDLRALDANVLLADSAALLEPLAAQKGIRLTVQQGRITRPVLADRERVLRVLSNLVGNAIFFTPAEGRVTLKCVDDEGCAVLSVADTGTGIPEQDQAHVFDRFWKSRDSRRGSGLGLAIARGIVEAHRGRIWLESRPGAGTTVHFTLPHAEPLTVGAERPMWGT